MVNSEKSLMIFTNEQFGEIRTLLLEVETWFVGKDVAKILGYSNASKAVLMHVDEEDKAEFPIWDGSQNRNTFLINESGLYSLILSSKLDSAKQFKKWITSEVLPTIRKSGGYVASADLMVNTYFGSLDNESKVLIKGLFLNIEEQQKLLQLKDKEIEAKEDIIIGLVDEISLAEKRQRLNKIIRHTGANYPDRWNLLYKEFEMKYHINLSERIASYNASNRPKIKGTLDYIDIVMGKLPELYEIACKLFENDVKKLIAEMYELNQ